ncbi:predicted protein, partial [Nematostella vectensis]
GAVFLASVLSNGVIIYLILTRAKLRTAPNAFICSLSVADMVLTVLITPFEFLCFRAYPGLCDVWILKLFYDMAVNASVFNLCALTLDRYLAAGSPLNYMSAMTSQKIKWIISFTWIAAILTPLP